MKNLIPSKSVIVFRKTCKRYRYDIFEKLLVFTVEYLLLLPVEAKGSLLTSLQSSVRSAAIGPLA
ncbi:MAG TPA: hypothetical protein VFG09_07810 [Thermodesulfovibrionales bacterium]|nr:hypothetical protein [Thermodesulfovibrionales bacterium]